MDLRCQPITNYDQVCMNLTSIQKLTKYEPDTILHSDSRVVPQTSAVPCIAQSWNTSLLKTSPNHEVYSVVTLAYHRSSQKGKDYSSSSCHKRLPNKQPKMSCPKTCITKNGFYLK